MTTNVSPIVTSVNVGEILNDTIDIEGLLKGTELASMTPASPVVAPTAIEPRGDLTIASVVVNTAEQTVEGRPVAVGEGIDYTISGFVSGVYTVKIIFWTSATVAAKRISFAKYEVCG